MQYAPFQRTPHLKGIRSARFPSRNNEGKCIAATSPPEPTVAKVPFSGKAQFSLEVQCNAFTDSWRERERERVAVSRDTDCHETESLTAPSCQIPARSDI